MAEIAIEHDPGRRRYVMTSDGAPAAVAQYRLESDALVVTHTEIDDAFGGQGLGSRLVAYVLRDARDRGLAIVPRCPFVRDYIAGHPEERDLVPEARRAEFGL